MNETWTERITRALRHSRLPLDGALPRHLGASLRKTVNLAWRCSPQACGLVRRYVSENRDVANGLLDITDARQERRPWTRRQRAA